MDHSEMYARLGQVISKALYKHLSAVTKLPAPGGRTFRLRMTERPSIYYGGWTFGFEVKLPKKEGYLTFGVMQVDSAFDADKISLPLPPKDFEDDSFKEFPPAHQQAFYQLVDIVKNEITSRGFKHGTYGDFLINEDYYPSRGVSVSVMRLELLTKELARKLQLALQNRQFSFFVALSLAIDDPGYKGKEEGITVRVDRIVEDWNTERLRREFGKRFRWRGSRAS